MQDRSEEPGERRGGPSDVGVVAEVVGRTDALYVRHGDGYVGTTCTRGSWYADGQGGGAVLALLGHVLEEVPTLTPMSVTRFTVDIVAPVPVGRHLTVSTEVVREGKRIQLVDLVLRVGDAVTTRARALRIRDRDVRGVPGLPDSTTTVDPASTLPTPDGLYDVERFPGVAEFLRLGVEMRRTTEPVEGVHGLRARLRVPVVAGEPVRPTSLAVLPLDLVNLLGVSLTRLSATAINPDVSGHLCRAPVGEWVALTGDTHFAHRVGHGFSTALMSDAEGVFGVTSTSQILEPVPEA